MTKYNRKFPEQNNKEKSLNLVVIFRENVCKNQEMCSVKFSVGFGPKGTPPKNRKLMLSSISTNFKF